MGSLLTGKVNALQNRQRVSMTRFRKLSAKVAGDLPAVERPRQRALGCAGARSRGGSGWKNAAGRRIQRRRQLAFEHDPLPPRDARHARRRRQQRLRVGVQRPREDALLGSLLHDEAQVHHQHVVRDVAHHAQVVRDEQVGQAQVALQVGQQVQHLRLNRHIERRYRLVGHEQRGIEHQGARDGDALALAAGEHVRIAVVVLGPQPDLRQHGASAFGAHGGRQRGVDLQRRFQNGADLLARIERAVGILEHQLHGACATRVRSGGRVDGIHAVQHKRARGRRLDQRHHARQRRFAAARFADHGQRLAGVDRERDAADRLQVRRFAQHAAAHFVDAGL